VRSRPIEAIARAVPEAIVGAGTVRSDRTARAAHAAGARFAVSPGWSPRVAAACRSLGSCAIAGVASASEVMQAADEGFRFLKFPRRRGGRNGDAQGAGQGPFADIAFCHPAASTRPRRPAIWRSPTSRSSADRG
jgi:2-dehydro-3-deoxyphosphogluconate aldolase/(4S)-4-hydroxy-2-oxoglutarate aldolase